MDLVNILSEWLRNPGNLLREHAPEPPPPPPLEPYAFGARLVYSKETLNRGSKEGSLVWACSQGKATIEKEGDAPGFCLGVLMA